jgi:hypothetical protein
MPINCREVAEDETDHSPEACKGKPYILTRRNVDFKRFSKSSSALGLDPFLVGWYGPLLI